MSTTDSKTIEKGTFQPSELGTLSFWNVNYDRELESFKEFGDEGEVWFGEDSSDEILDWVARFIPPPLSGSLQESFIIDDCSQMEAVKKLNNKRPQILDVGCGNGQLLFLLVQGGYGVENLTGIDYSAGSIELTNEIAQLKGINGLRLEVKDIIKDEVNPPLLNSNGKERRGWDLITDKGTFDAICLSNEELEGRKLSEHYPSRISDLLVKPGGIFLITSCNWTEDELISKFVKPEFGLRVHSKIPRHCFTFGGNSGSTITTIAFEAC
ncbi:S-adenosyl-L-methionine-dependent methyltransferase [Phakopsora pachyrhizi]|uniref:Protein-lysine N-methyltransferase EFM4 n=1 Tax=Phakopsora pachyrhizi TaxID=170000 RepID=A0AAV0AHI9_PHAPC|nr:S-adenosyl-L-methionine-dependent methyltransferase [Phakopsora pachyrhizi]CAH7666513.1 S-adenosyl-L-methionine-dependent methyltransferase [Phakopsora pachyrhizi]